MFPRRALLFSLITMFACKNENDRMELLPMTLGEWRRMSVENIPPEEHPADLKQRGIKRSRRGTYQGQGRIVASIYEFGAQAVAFEMVQKFRPEPRKIAFQQGAHFVILEAEQDDSKAMNSFATLLEESLKR